MDICNNNLKNNIVAWDTGLYGRAREIAESNLSPIRVMAGPGTGKSFALKRRVARLLEEGVDPHNMLVVTFTRNAAANLVEDLTNLGVEGCEEIRIGTLHAFCYSVLMRHEVLQILGRFPRPLLYFNRSGVMQYEGAPFLEDLLHGMEYGNRRKATKSIRAFEAAWARLQTDEPGWALSLDDQRFHDSLIGWLLFHKAILIGELVPLALRYLRENPMAVERSRFGYVIVDEFQDLNKAEQVLLDYLSEESNYFLVGDADQSIYSFRYAHPSGITAFGVTHPGTNDKTLEVCRRCPKSVVRIADELIRKNYPVPSPQRLIPNEGNSEGNISIVQWGDLQQEVNGIEDYCSYLINRAGVLPKDILILCPRRLIGYGIRDRLLELEVPVHSFYYEEVLEPIEVQTNLCLLSLYCNNDDRVSFRFWLGLGSPSWNYRGYSELRIYCRENNISPFSCMEEVIRGNITLHFSGPLILKFQELKRKLAEIENKKGSDLLDYLFPEGIDGNVGAREVALGKITAETEPESLLDLLRTQISQPEMPEEGDFVRIMSLHKSKGLTSKVVIISGCIEGLCPVYDDDLPPQEIEAILQEQRRLFYMAITRCQETLVFSSVLSLEKRIAYKIGAKVRGLNPHIGYTITSRFINELGPSAPRPVAGNTWVEHTYNFP
jgi:superfamily I DNA/RNA helicase